MSPSILLLSFSLTSLPFHCHRTTNRSLPQELCPVCSKPRFPLGWEWGAFTATMPALDTQRPPQQGQTPQGNPGTSLAVASSPGIKNWAVTSLKAGFLIWDGLLTRYIYKAGHWILKCVLLPSHWLGSSSLKSMWHSGIQYIPWKLSVSCNVIKQTINLQQQQQGLKISPISVTRPFLQQPSTLERIKTTQLLTRL